MSPTPTVISPTGLPRPDIRKIWARQEAARRAAETATRWQAMLMKAFASPLLGKARALPKEYVTSFGQQSNNPSTALLMWIELARSDLVQIPGEGFFELLPEIVMEQVFLTSYKQAQSAPGRWQCLRGMLKKLKRDGKRGAGLADDLNHFVQRMLGLSMPMDSGIPLSELGRKDLRVGESGRRAEALFSSLIRFLGTGDISKAMAQELCSHVRKGKVDAGSLRALLNDESPGIRQVAELALRAEFEAQREEHKIHSAPRIHSRLVLQRFLIALGDADLAQAADEKWRLLGEPSVAEGFALEVRARAWRRQVRRRNVARKQDNNGASRSKIRSKPDK